MGSSVFFVFFLGCSAFDEEKQNVGFLFQICYFIEIVSLKTNLGDDYSLKSVFRQQRGRGKTE